MKKNVVEKKRMNLYHNYNSVIKNVIWIENEVDFKKKLKFLLYNILLMIFVPYNGEQKDTVHVINSRSEFRTRDFLESQDIYYGRTFSNIKELRGQYSHISGLKRRERCRIFVRCIVSYHNVKTVGGCFGYWLDFCIWDRYLGIQRPKVLISNGHYDRLTTTLSVLCELHSIQFWMKQHGLLSEKVIPPKKIHCNRVYAFDDMQAEIFRRLIVCNDDCEYINWYNPGFKFNHVKFKEYTIGVIENRSELICEIYDIITGLKKYCERDMNIYIMLHPLSNEEDYAEEVRNIASQVTFTREKYLDYDLLISTPSTLAYDYIREGYSCPIVLAEFGHGIAESFAGYHNVIHAENAEKLDAILKEYLKA